jgi:hypothetical protein
MILSCSVICHLLNLALCQDPAFLDRVDIKQHVPPPSSAAVYDIFRSCLNELIRTSLLTADSLSNKDGSSNFPSPSPKQCPTQTPQAPPPARKRRRVAKNPSPPPSDKPEAFIHVPVASFLMKEPTSVPTLPATLMSECQDPSSPGQRVWKLAQKCQGLHLSGRTLRRLPVLGLAMYTWGGEVGMDEAIGALEKAVEEETVATQPEA